MDVFMQEKVMVNDTLAMIKSGLATYAQVISECANQSLRSAIQQIRNSDETSQYELYTLAQSKGFYQPASMASDAEITQVKSQLSGS